MSTGGSGRFTRAGYVLCSACQAENLASNRFCDRCGTRIGVSTRSPLLKPDATPPVYPSSPPGEDAASSTPKPAYEAPSATDPVPIIAAPTDDAAPPRTDLAPAPVPDAGSTPESVSETRVRETGAVTTQSPSGTGAPVERATPPRPAGSASGAAAEPPARGLSPTDVPANDGTIADSALPRGAAGSTRPLLVLLGIAGVLVAVCVALWVLLVFLGAINFTLRGASFATSVATIVATRAP